MWSFTLFMRQNPEFKKYVAYIYETCLEYTYVNLRACIWEKNMKTIKHPHIYLPLPDNARSRLKDYISMSEQTEVSAFCQPLQQVGIDFFLYVRRCHDGHYLHLTNHPEWLAAFLLQKLYSQCFFHQQTHQYGSGNYLWQRSTSQKAIEEELCQQFAIKNILTRIEPNNDCQEFFCFGSKANSADVMDIYINHFDLLERFILCFKDNYYAEINNTLSMRVIVPAPHCQNHCLQKYPEQPLKKYYSLSKLERYYIGTQDANVYLTRREIEVIEWYMQGKKIPEISIILAISPRTVETHLNKIKQKTNCYERMQFIARFSALLANHAYP